ncbi:MAG: precorrin-2 C(20)-methyltransferase [Oscillospiraceae bacterium]|nr:precorrin-2 C(20)-methyltransferase [Oscillospiraceae bacterium]
MRGKFYSVGIGPGDAEYITLKAKRVIESADIIAVPVKKYGEKSTAFGIVRKAVDMGNKRVEEIEFSMDRDRSKRLQSRQDGVEKIARLLDEGNNVAMITLGDVSVYSTCTYVNRQIKCMGYENEIVSGIPSFCAAAARAGISLCEENETLAIIPALTSEENLDKALDGFDNVVIMKAGRNTDRIYSCLKRRGMIENAVVTSEIGMENELIEPIAQGGEYGYFTTVIITKKPIVTESGIIKERTEK